MQTSIIGLDNCALTVLKLASHSRVQCSQIQMVKLMVEILGLTLDRAPLAHSEMRSHWLLHRLIVTNSLQEADLSILLALQGYLLPVISTSVWLTCTANQAKLRIMRGLEFGPLSFLVGLRQFGCADFQSRVRIGFQGQQAAFGV